MEKKNYYIVVTKKWGLEDTHSYIVGLFNNINKAIKCADSHKQYRGSKYKYQVEEVQMNIFDNNLDYYSKLIYTTDGNKNKS